MSHPLVRRADACACIWDGRGAGFKLMFHRKRIHPPTTTCAHPSLTCALGSTATNRGSGTRKRYTTR